MFETLLVANRGEIARRITRTAHQLGVKVVAVHSEADAHALHVREADDSVLLGPAPPAQSYLDGARIIEAALRSGAQAVHPGYGFLSESAAFAAAVVDAGLVWVGPSPEAIEAMGDKVNARARMAAAGVPVSRGTDGPVAGPDDAVAAARDIGYPVMVKPAAGGGGIGMAIARDDASLRAAVETAATRAERAFGSARVYLEAYVERARHVEVQILGHADGTVTALGERDCSPQRRHQKVAEESPSPGVDPDLRERMADAAVRAGLAVGYRSTGTVECLVDDEAQEFFFLEMNTRLQVEHPVTELVTGRDQVADQLRIAAGLPVLPVADPPGGHALELRVYAEDPVRFLPSPGTLTAWDEPVGAGIRVDSGYAAGDAVTPYYDPLLAKLCLWSPSRPETLALARDAVARFDVAGVKTNLPFFAELLAEPAFVSGDYDTGLVPAMRSCGPGA